MCALFVDVGCARGCGVMDLGVRGCGWCVCILVSLGRCDVCGGSRLWFMGGGCCKRFTRLSLLAKAKPSISSI